MAMHAIVHDIKCVPEFLGSMFVPTQDVGHSYTTGLL